MIPELISKRCSKKTCDGHPIITNRSLWREFPVVTNARLYHENIVLLGDAGRSAHFSIGSGTKLAMEDAIALADIFRRRGNRVGAALEEYQQVRKPEADRLQRTAVTSLNWFENIDRYARQDAPQFTFNMMVRSKRVTYDNLSLRDPAFIRAIDKWFAEHTRKLTGYADIDTENPAPPMFQPFRIGRMRVENRVQLSAMCQYCAVDGLPGEWHFVHYGARAVGGVGLVNTEMLCTSADARITPGCAGLWNAEQTEQWRRICDFVHTHSKAKICAQVGHAGRKGATCVPWQGGIDQPLPENAWEIGRAFAPAVPGAQPLAQGNVGSRHGQGGSRFRECHAERRHCRVRHAGTARGARLPVIFIHQSLYQPAR